MTNERGGENRETAHDQRVGFVAGLRIRRRACLVAESLARSSTSGIAECLDQVGIVRAVRAVLRFKRSMKNQVQIPPIPTVAAALKGARSRESAGWRGRTRRG